MKIKLLKTHHHAGKLYLADDELDVSNETAHWLVEHGIAVPVKEPKPKTTVNKQEQNDDNNNNRA